MSDFGFKKLAEPLTNECSVEIRMADFKVGMAPSYKLKVEAEGYEPLVTEFTDLAEGDQIMELALTPSSNAKGGKPLRFLNRLGKPLFIFQR